MDISYGGEPPAGSSDSTQNKSSNLSITEHSRNNIAKSENREIKFIKDYS